MADLPKPPAPAADQTRSLDERERNVTAPIGRAKRPGFLERNDSLLSTQPDALVVQAQSSSTTQPQLQAVIAAPLAHPGQSVLRPELPTAIHEIDERLVLKREPDSSRAANYRVLRHRIGQSGNPRVLVVSSAEPKAGKTTVAANLALALSECGRAQVLLVEANFRHPQLGELFGFFPSACFHAQLEAHRERPLDPYTTVELYAPYLQLLAVSPSLPRQPLEDGPTFSSALKRLAQGGYEYIVVDTPPVLGAADVNLVAAQADGVLLVARAGHTKSGALRAAVEQLAPTRIIGITLLDV